MKPARPLSRWQIRKSAARAFVLRNRSAAEMPPLRRPDGNETPLSPAEISHGVRYGLISMDLTSRAPSHLLTTAQKGGTS